MSRYQEKVIVEGERQTRGERQDSLSEGTPGWALAGKSKERPEESYNTNEARRTKTEERVEHTDLWVCKQRLTLSVKGQSWGVRFPCILLILKPQFVR